MMKSFNCFLTLLFILGLLPAAAQQKYERIDKTFRITGISEDRKARDTVLGWFTATAQSGLEPGISGVVYSKGSTGYYNLEIGTGFVVSVEKGFAYVYLISSKESLTDSNYMAKVGDLITLEVKVPKKEKKSIFYELDLLGISFYRRDNDQPIWDFEELAARDGKTLTDSLLAECIRECKRTYEQYKDNPALDSAYYTPANTGRNKGRSIMDVFRNTTAKDLLPMLAYVKENKTWYRGKQFYLSYSLAGWLYANSSYSSQEMLDSLLSYPPASKKFRDFVGTYKDEILKGGFVEKWSFTAMNLQSAEKDRAADSVLNVSRSASRILQDAYSFGLHYLAEAQICQYRGNFSEAVAFCDSGLLYLKPQQYGFYNIEFLLKKGYLYQRLKMLKEAGAAYDMAATVAADTSTHLGYDQVATVLGRIYSMKGDTYDAFDDYAGAIAAYQSSVNNYRKDQSYFSVTKIADVQGKLADVYKKQGAYADASEIYTELKTTYVSMSDIKNGARTNDNLGYVQFKQGKYREAMANHRQAEKIYDLLKLHAKAAFSLSQIGQAYWNLGNYDSAIVCHYTAISKARLGQSPADEAYSWSQLGNLYGIVGDKTKALAAYDSSSYAFELAKDSSGLVDNLIAVGDVFKNDKQYEKAYGYFMKAHQLNLKRGSVSSVIDTWFKLGSAAYFYDTALARKNYTECYRLAKTIDDKSNQLYSALNLGLLATRTYDYNLSENYFNEGLRLCIEQNSKSDEAYTYEQIGYGKQQKLEFDKAFSSFSTAFRIYDSLGERSKLPQLYANLGYALQSKGEFEKSIEYYEKSKLLAYDIKNLADVANALQYLSFAYTLSGDPQKSLQSADSSLVIYRGLENNWQIANSYLTLGNAYNGISDYQKAVSYYMMADSMYLLDKDDWSSGTCMNNIGNVYYHQADYPTALKYFLEADRKYKKIKVVNESILLTRTNIGETYYAMKNFAKAKEYLLDANKRAKENGATRTLAGSSIVLAKIATAEDKFDEAKDYLKQALDVAYKSREAIKIIEAHLAYGRLYAKENNIGGSIAQFRNATDHARKTKTDKYLWEALYELGLGFYNRDDHDSAIIVFKEAVEVIDAGASKLFGGAEAKKIYSADLKKVDLYNKLVASLAKLKKTEEALFYADKSNSQAIKEKMEQSGIVTTDKNKNEALKKGNELLQKQTAIEQAIAKEKAKPEKERNNQLIASLESVRKVAEEDYLNFIEELVKAYPDLNSYFSKTNPRDFRNFIDVMPDSTIAILYVMNDNQLFIFTVTNQETGIKVVELKEDLNKQAGRLLAILKNPENATGTGAIQVRATIKDKNAVKGDFKKESTELYNLLITPIIEQLKDKKNLCIIPNAKLSSIPFSALGRLGDNNQFHFIIEDFAVFYTNKMDIFSRPYAKRKIDTSMVAFGNPDKTLPGATLEVNNIRDIYPNTKVFLEDAATEQKAKESFRNYRFVHFATHGVLDNTDFSKSYLLLNSDGDNDGRFTIPEINGLNKPETDMVFLSACELAVSQEVTKGWDISAANAFLNNRVRTVVASLWQVPDEATTILLTEFYQNLKTMSRSDALRHAQAKLSQNPKYSHPYCWGAFVMYGEWR